MAADALIVRLLLAAAVALLIVGAITAWASPNVAKRLAGVVLGFVGAIVALATLAAPPIALVAAGAAAFAYLSIGVAVLVRLQESYGTIEAADIDRADAEDEAAGGGT